MFLIALKTSSHNPVTMALPSQSLLFTHRGPADAWGANRGLEPKSAKSEIGLTRFSGGEWGKEGGREVGKMQKELFF